MDDLESAPDLVKTLESDLKRLGAKVDALMKLRDAVEVERLPKTMAWAMDSNDRELWLSIWSDDVHYIVPQYGIEITGKEALREFGERAVFGREEKKFSALTNIMVEVDGDTATGRDYYMHYGYPIDPETGKPSGDRAFSEGMHHYEFRRTGGSWKIARMEVRLNRRQEARS